TELAKAPEMVNGFHDNILMDSVEDSARFGVVAGIAAGTTTATATSVGTVTATSAGFSTTTLVVAGVAGAVAVGGTAAAVSSGGSSDTPTYAHTPTYPETNTTTETCSDVTGSWYGSSHYSDGAVECAELFVSFTQSGCEISTGSFYSCSDTGETNQISGTVSGTTIKYGSTAGGDTYTGDITSTTISGTWSDSTHGSTGVYSLSKSN
ncbi:MAG: hypothetical protein U9N42_01810, partial [Campylobacterota bacterium]|nr:hypothetical protein [Campylobacterota bacterium]